IMDVYGYTGSYSMPMRATDWIGATIDASEGVLYVNDQRYDSGKIPSGYFREIQINLPDLDWWLRYRYEPQDRAPQLSREDTQPGDSADFIGTGAPGRPSSMPLIRRKFEERCHNEEALPTLAREANWLATWVAGEHPKRWNPRRNPVRCGWHGDRPAPLADI